MVLGDLPVKSGYVAALFTADPGGLAGRLEAGYRFLPNLATYGFGEVRTRGWSAGAGLKLTF